MPGNRLIHRIIDHFGEQMMQCLFIRPANIHARTAADRFETLEHFDSRSGITGFPGRSTNRGLVG